MRWYSKGADPDAQKKGKSVRGGEYRWRANGNDGYISIVIWPTNKIGPFIQGTFRYHETWIDKGGGRKSSAGNQIVITNRIIRRIIDYAVATYGYNPLVRGKQLNLKVFDDVVKWDDAIRGSGKQTRLIRPPTLTLSNLISR